MNNDEHIVKGIIQEYIDACTVGDVARLRAIFHKNP